MADADPILAVEQAGRQSQRPPLWRTIPHSRKLCECPLSDFECGRAATPKAALCDVRAIPCQSPYALWATARYNAPCVGSSAGQASQWLGRHCRCWFVPRSGHRPQCPSQMSRAAGAWGAGGCQVLTPHDSLTRKRPKWWPPTARGATRRRHYRVAVPSPCLDWDHGR